MWFAEGVAQYQVAAARHDRWDANRDMVLRVAALEEQLLSFGPDGGVRQVRFRQRVRLRPRLRPGTLHRRRARRRRPAAALRRSLRLAHPRDRRRRRGGARHHRRPALRGVAAASSRGLHRAARRARRAAGRGRRSPTRGSPTSIPSTRPQETGSPSSPPDRGSTDPTGSSSATWRPARMKSSPAAWCRVRPGRRTDAGSPTCASTGPTGTARVRRTCSPATWRAMSRGCCRSWLGRCREWSSPTPPDRNG